MLTSLFSLFYVTREFHRFLHRGKPKYGLAFLYMTNSHEAPWLLTRIAFQQPRKCFLAEKH